jgi:23S rRNA (cytidine1920-2'-O)/16S rRNA (cytidine1409-2'-O)-methyltransferase
LSKPIRPRFVALTALLSHHHPDVSLDLIARGHVLVDGRVIANPEARVRSDASLRVLPHHRLRGDVKLSHALETLDIPVKGRVALDLGASAGGFTTALLDRGAIRVYAVDAGVGQLVGRLRADPRVVNLEGRNLGGLKGDDVPEAIGLIVMDLSYLPLAEAIPQLAPLQLHPQADLVALVKPTFELRRGRLAASESDLADALTSASGAAQRAGWTVLSSAVAPRTGRRGALECFLHARRRQR